MYKIIIISLSLILSACSNSGESEIKSAVRNTLKDPSSAQFGELAIFTAPDPEKEPDLGGACIVVNARNAMGGYSGDKIAILLKHPDTGGVWEVSKIEDIPFEGCKSIFGAIFKQL